MKSKSILYEAFSPRLVYYGSVCLFDFKIQVQHNHSLAWAGTGDVKHVGVRDACAGRHSDGTVSSIRSGIHEHWFYSSSREQHIWAQLTDATGIEDGIDGCIVGDAGKGERADGNADILYPR